MSNDCNCAPGIDGLVIHNSWAHPQATCPKCGVAVTDQTPSSFYPWHDERCGGELEEPISAGKGQR